MTGNKKVTVRCNQCKATKSIPIQSFAKWIGGWLCERCQMKRYNGERRSGGDFRVMRNKVVSNE